MMSIWNKRVDEGKLPAVSGDCGVKDLWNWWVLNVEWKSGGVMDMKVVIMKMMN